MILTKIEAIMRDEIPFDSSAKLFHDLLTEYSSKCVGYMKGFYYHTGSQTWVYIDIFDTVQNAADSMAKYEQWPKSNDQIVLTKEDGLTVTYYEIIEGLL